MRDVDYTASVAFLRKFFAHTQGNVELRAIGSESGNEKPDFTRDPERVEEFCQRNDEPGTAIYFGCATRIVGHSRGKRANLAEIICALIDIDVEKLGLAVDEVVAVLKGCPCPPSIIVFSGHGIHAYWLWREAMDVTGWDEDQDAAYTAFLKRLAACFAGDDKCTDLPRVMRLPGTHNSKKTEAEPDGGWHQCVVLDENDTRYELGDLVEMLDLLRGRRLIVAPEVAQGGQSSVPFNQPNTGDPFAAYGLSGQRFDMSRLDRMSYQDAENPIHATRVAGAASLVRKGEMADGEILEFLLEKTRRAAGVAGERWNWRQEEATIAEEIASAHQKYDKPLGEVVQLRPREQPIPDAAPRPGEAVRNDISNAMQLLALHGSRLCYVEEAGWHIWDGKRYRRDNEMISAHRLGHDVSAQQLAAAIRIADKDARKAAIKWAITTGTRGRIAAMLHEARSYAVHKADEMDAGIWLLNCQNGTLDLRDGVLRPHAPTDLITKICGTVYDPNAICPRWESFLAEIFDGDQEMVRFVQCALGYSLTGAMKENVFFILHGTGKNGKSKLLEAAAHVLGDYMMSTPADTWAEKQPGAASNDVAALPGARFVTTVETEKNHSLRAGLIKQITGGDKVSARKMYHDFFEFTPQCKLWIATNNKPKVGGSDSAIWDRIRLLPFNIKFVPAAELADGQKVRDNDLMEKLLLELPGILAWMVRGCTEWQRSGLPPAVAITEAAEVYRSSEDGVQRFIDECCDLSHGITCAFKDLFAAYEIWCGVRDEEAVSKKALGGNFEERGYAACKSGAVRSRKGIDLKGNWRTAVEKGVPPDDVVAAEKVGTEGQI